MKLDITSKLFVIYANRTACSSVLTGSPIIIPNTCPPTVNKYTKVSVMQFFNAVLHKRRVLQPKGFYKWLNSFVFTDYMRLR